MVSHDTRLLFVLVCGALLPCEVWAQTAGVRLVAERETGKTFEVTVGWPGTLQQAVDSTGSTHLTFALASAASGGLLHALEKLELPVHALPRVQTVSSAYDEISLPPSADADTLAMLLGGPPAEAIGLGIERKRPTATLLARLLTYDEATATLRRYRRIVIEVDYGRAADGGAVLGMRRANRAASPSPHREVSQSVLADGYVFKIPVAEEGVYRIDRAYLDALLRQAGLSAAALQPDQIKLYGNGGEPLPALNSAPRPVDLAEVPVWVRTDGQGFADLLFYAQGPDGWRYDAATQAWEHYVHPYTTHNYYFLKIDAGGAPGQRVAGGIFPSFPDAQRLSSVQGRAFKDFDDVMWSQDGRGGLTWVSRQIRTYESLDVQAALSAPGLTSGTVEYLARAAVRSNPAGAVVFTSGTAQLAREAAGSVGTDSDQPIAQPVMAAFTQPAVEGQVPGLTMRVEGPSSGAIEPQAALDWIRMFYPQALRAEDGYLRFATPAGQTGRLELVLSGFSQPPVVWDVTGHNAVQPLGVQAQNGAYVVQVEASSSDQPREIVAFEPSAARPVEPGIRVSPQNLHGIQLYPEFVIVTPDTFRVFAEDLAQHRRSQGMSVEVADVDAIYNEFSGGLPDVRAVRDYFKFLYDRAPDEPSLLRYALLFGDGHYNYRALEREPQLDNWILPYESEETFRPLESFTSDDYFGLLDDEEGEWPYGGHTVASPEKVDIGIGRFPVQTVADAQAMIDKIKRYESGETYGPWRTRYAFLADDDLTGLAGTTDERDLHTQNADVVAETVRDLFPMMNVEKIYAISYDRVFSGIWRIPAAHQDVLETINNGVLVFNYSGHGGIDGLAQEGLFTKEDAANLDNGDRLPIFVTATCSFGRWDMDDTQSAAEVLLHNPNGGAVSLFTTVRTVFTNHIATTLNLGLNRQLNLEMFEPDENGQPRRLGDILRETKNVRVGLEGNNRKFNLLGDPTLRLGLPSAQAVATEVNGVPVDSMQAQLPALGHVTIEGEVRMPGGSLDESFNGAVHLTVYDAERRVPVEEQHRLANPYYVVRQDLLWRGEVTAAGGRYQAEFIVPKDISYSNQPGRISIYARSSSGQAVGYTENVLVGGSAANPPDDDEGPQVQLFLNDTTFVSGGLTHPRPELIMKLYDRSGVNTVGAGVGHEMLLTVDRDDAGAVNLGNYYESDGDSYQQGEVRYAFSEYLGGQPEADLAPGPHTIEVKVWDVLNHSTTAALDFYVAAGEELAVRNVFNYPNPMASSTQFVFEHNQLAGTLADVQIRIYTLSGRPVKTIEWNDVLSGGIVQVPWDGRDDDFDRLATGVYLYKLRIRVDMPEGGRQAAEHVERLAIIR